MKPIIGIVSTPNFDNNGGKMFCTDLKVHNWVIKCGGIPLSIMPTNIDDVFNKTENNHYIEDINAHNVRIENGTLLKKILNKDTLLVSSRHNYCVHDLNKFKISGIADDGVIEAIENPKCKFNIGLQWHPELFDFDHEDSINIFNSFIKEAIIYSSQKVSKKTIY